MTTKDDTLNETSQEAKGKSEDNTNKAVNKKPEDANKQFAHKTSYELIVEDTSLLSQEMVAELSNIAILSMKTILNGRTADIQNAKKYSDFISDDIIDKLILKYNKTHSFTVVVFLSIKNTLCFEASKGFLGSQDVFLKCEYSDDNWICNTLITMINRLSRDPLRKVETPDKIEGDMKKTMSEEMEKILSGKTWLDNYNNTDCNVIVANLIDKLKFKFPNYFFTLNCILRNDDSGFTSFSNNYCFYSKEDSTCFEIFNTNSDDLAKNSIFCTIYASFFKNK